MVALWTAVELFFASKRRRPDFAEQNLVFKQDKKRGGVRKVKAYVEIKRSEERRFDGEFNS